MRARVVLALAAVFSIAMGALSEGGWWWAWLAVVALPVLSGRVRLPLPGGLDPVARFVMRENARTRRDNRRTRRERRRRVRDQRRAIRRQRRQVQ